MGMMTKINEDQFEQSSRAKQRSAEQSFDELYVVRDRQPRLPSASPDEPDERYSLGTRVRIIVGLGVLAWAPIIALLFVWLR